MADNDHIQVQDELDKASIDQLHAVVLQLGSNCFESKKLCVTVLISASVLITSFTRNQLDVSFFVGGSMVSLFFWFLDSYSYYYQEKLRARMKVLAESIAGRHTPIVGIEGVGMPLSELREKRGRLRRTLHSAFNSSMAFYAVLLAVCIVLALLHHHGWIRSVPLEKK